MTESDSLQVAIEDDEQEMSYSEIYTSASLNGEIVITIPVEEEDRVRTGLKNFKNKLTTKLKEENLPLDNSTLVFVSSPSMEYEGCIDLSVQVKTRGTVKIKAIRIPDGYIPE